MYSGCSFLKWAKERLNTFSLASVENFSFESICRYCAVVIFFWVVLSDGEDGADGADGSDEEDGEDLSDFTQL